MKNIYIHIHTMPEFAHRPRPGVKQMRRRDVKLFKRRKIERGTETEEHSRKKRG